MLDECFNKHLNCIEYPDSIKNSILSSKNNSNEFNDKYGEFNDGDEGFITPYGTILHCGSCHHHSIIKDILDNSYIKHLVNQVKNRSLKDIMHNVDDSVLVADALDHGFIRFSANGDNISEFGKTTTKKALDLLYDFVDYVI